MSAIREAGASYGAQRTVYAVAELNDILRALVEDSLPSLWVQGEISNFSKPGSGHWYFTLKDEQAQIRCAMFRKANYYIRPLPQNGDQVLLRAKACVYATRGELQLIVEHLEPAGTGALLQAFEALKRKLAAEGLFDTALKRPLPSLPRGIGLVTSATGAAVHDVLTTLARRWPLAQAVLHPVPVQGVEAAGAIVKALARIGERADVDVVLLVRGGGSIEDLAPFNTEIVAQAIRACAKPVVTGIGHEIDVSIADFAADLRAATPTAAAELATPDAAGHLDRIDSRFHALVQAFADRLAAHEAGVGRYESRLKQVYPGRRLEDRAQRLDELEQRLRRCIQARLTTRAATLATQASGLRRCDPRLLAQGQRQTVQRLFQRLDQGWQRHQARRAGQFGQAASLLESFSPLAVLKRGYAIVQHREGAVLRNADATRRGEILRIALAHGALEAEVRELL